MTFLKKLRDAAMVCTNLGYRELLKAHADNVSAKIDLVYVDPTEVNMRLLNASWARADRVYRNRPEEGTPAPISGSPEPAILAA